MMRIQLLVAVAAAALLGGAARAEDDPEKPKPAKEVKVPTEDGLVLAADLYEPAGGGERKPAVVAIHAEGGDRSMWKDAAAAFAARGFSVLALDMRGHGGSRIQRGTDPKDGDPGADLSAKAAAHDPELFSAMWRDAAAGVKYLRATLLCDGAKISVVGCGACGAAGLDAAARDAKVAAALWIGPAANNFGAGAMDAVRKWDGRPMGLMTTEKNGRTDFDNIARVLVKQPRVETIVLHGPAAAAGEIVAKGENGTDEVVQFVYGWIERPKLTGKTRPEDNSGPGKIVVAQSSEGIGMGGGGGLSFSGNEAPAQMEGMVVLACADGSAKKLPAGARRITLRPAKGAEPCVDMTIEQWSGTGWSKVESRVACGFGAIVLGKEVNTWELWLSPRELGVKPFGAVAVAYAKIIKGKPNWNGDVKAPPMSGMPGMPSLPGPHEFKPDDPSTWEKQSLR
jgi:pimeloyl-ACP methyl ester carboxylesterase